MSGNIQHLVEGNDTEESAFEIGGGENLEEVRLVESCVKNRVNEVLTEDIIGLKKQNYRNNKNDILKKTLNSITSILDIDRVFLSFIGIGEENNVYSFLQEVYGNIVDYILDIGQSKEIQNVQKFQEILNILFASSQGVLGFIDSEKVRFHYMLKMMRSPILVEYIPFLIADWHFLLGGSGNEVENFFFVELGVQKYESISDIICIFFLLDSLEQFGQVKCEYSLIYSLKNIKKQLYEKFKKYAFIEFEQKEILMEVWNFFERNAIGIPERLQELAKSEQNFFQAFCKYTEEIQGTIIQFRELKIANDYGIILDKYGITPHSIFSMEEGKPTGNILPYQRIFSEIQNIFPDKLQEKNEDYTFLIQLLHHPKTMTQIEDAIGIHFSDYPFSIQPYFLRFLAYATTDDMVRVKTYLSHGKTPPEKLTRLRVFLSTAEGRSFGDLILDIDKRLIEKFGEIEGAKTGNELFEKYVEIMDIAEEDAESIKSEFYGSDSNAQFSKQKYIQELLGKANDTLKDFSKVLESESSSEVIAEHLSTCSIDMIQYGSLFRVTDKNLDTQKPLRDSLKELGIELVEKTGPEMNTDDKTAMMQLYTVNYQTHPNKEEFLVNTERALSENYQNLRVKFFVLKYRGSPLLSAKFVEQEDGSIYFGAFNTALYFQNNQLGRLVLERLLVPYSDKIIRCHVRSELENLIRYYGGYGFEIEKDANGNPLKPIVSSGMELCHMVRYPKIALKGLSDPKNDPTFRLRA